jgi:hypothetical protein
LAVTLSASAALALLPPTPSSPPFQETFGEKLTLQVIGFALTTIIGGILVFWLNRTLWRTQTEHAIARFDEGIKFLDELSELVGRRYFLLQRLFWALQNSAASKLEDLEKEYFEAVKEWNSRYWRSRNKIRLFVD